MPLNFAAPKPNSTPSDASSICPIIACCFENKDTALRLWQCINDGTPQPWMDPSCFDLLSYFQTPGNCVAFELFLQRLEWFDQRLFAANVLPLYQVLLLGRSTQRKMVSSYFLETLRNFKVNGQEDAMILLTSKVSGLERKLTPQIAADVILRIMGAQLVRMATLSHTSLLLQELFRVCSKSKQWQVLHIFVPHLRQLSTHAVGNYFVTCMLRVLRDQQKSTDTSNPFWRVFYNEFVRDMTLFAILAQNRYGSFVLKYFVNRSNVEIKQEIYARLTSCHLHEKLQRHTYGHFVLDKVREGVDLVCQE
jgi:hypothetical protein